MANNNGEPSTGPLPDRWYNLSLGSTFKEQSSSKFCTLRYDFKPASIDKSQPGSLHKNKENSVTVEFHNNQPGKPKVTFEGVSEDTKDNDGVLFFDGQNFRLERLHRAVKRLRHVRSGGEAASANATTVTSTGVGAETRSPPLGKISKTSQPFSRTIAHSLPVEIERIDVGDTESPGPRPTGRSNNDHNPASQNLSPSLDPKSSELEENLDIVADEDGISPTKTIDEVHAAIFGFELNDTNPNDTDEEIADVDASDDDKGPNAAEALRAQVNGDEGQQQAHNQTSSTSDSSGSSSSGSGSSSGSSSSDSEGSDDDSASSGGDIDV